MKIPLKPIKRLVINTATKTTEISGSGSSQWCVAAFEGKRVIAVPAIVK